MSTDVKDAEQAPAPAPALEPAPALAPLPQPKVEERLDKIQVVAFKTTYVGDRPVAEAASQPVTIFRAAVPDVWAFLVRALNGPR